MLSKIVIGFGALGLLICVVPNGVAQPQEVLIERGPGLVPFRHSTSTGEIRKALQTVSIETKDFQDEKPFREFAKKFEAAVSKKGKGIAIEIDREAFPLDNKEFEDVGAQMMLLPESPDKISANAALQMAAAQAGVGGTYWLRSGEIVITSHKRAMSGHFLESRVEANFTYRPLTEALDELAEQSGVSIIIDSRLAKRAQTRVSAKVAGKLDTVVRLLADAAGLRALSVDNVMYVTSPVNASQFKGKTDFQLNDTIREIAYKNRPLFGKSESIMGSWGGWVLDSRVKNQTSVRVTAKWINQVHQDTALRIMTDMAGLRHVVVEDIVYVTSPANAMKLAEERDRKKP